jgi:hypothetical protein
MGAAWGYSENGGDPSCEVCPRRGTADFDKLCMESGFSAQGMKLLKTNGMLKRNPQLKTSRSWIKIWWLRDGFV